MKAKLIKSNSKRYYIEIDNKLVDNAYLCDKNCEQLLLSALCDSIDVEIETEYDFNGIGYSQTFKLDEKNCLILKSVNEKTPSK